MHIIFLIKNMIDTITHCNDRISDSNRMSDLIILLVLCNIVIVAVYCGLYEFNENWLHLSWLVIQLERIQDS